MNKTKNIVKALLYRGVKHEIIGQKFHLYNFWPINTSKVQDMWLVNFIQYYNLLNTKKTVNLFSVFGNKEIVRFVASPKIFFTGENIHTKIVNSHHDTFDYKYLSKFDLALGFDKREDMGLENYIRFPLWIKYLIPFDSTFDDVKRIIDSYNDTENRKAVYRSKFASNISRHDNNGIRGQIIDTLNNVQEVECAGDFRNNTDELRVKFGDDKLTYLREFRFNICPENSNADGYTTEKIIESIQAGCIPVYWGSNNKPECSILNQDAIVFFNNDNPSETEGYIHALMNDEVLYEDFLSRKPFKEGAAVIIWDTLQELKTRLESL